MEIRGTAYFEADFEAEEYLQVIEQYNVTWTNIFIRSTHAAHARR